MGNAVSSHREASLSLHRKWVVEATMRVLVSLVMQAEDLGKSKKNLEGVARSPSTRVVILMSTTSR